MSYCSRFTNKHYRTQELSISPRNQGLTFNTILYTMEQSMSGTYFVPHTLFQVSARHNARPLVMAKDTAIISVLNKYLIYLMKS
jgi:hypothetical protein